jgi:hypothetical protein
VDTRWNQVSYTAADSVQEGEVSEGWDWAARLQPLRRTVRTKKGGRRRPHPPPVPVPPAVTWVCLGPKSKQSGRIEVEFWRGEGNFGIQKSKFVCHRHSWQMHKTQVFFRMHKTQIRRNSTCLSLRFNHLS